MKLVKEIILDQECSTPTWAKIYRCPGSLPNSYYYEIEFFEPIADEWCILEWQFQTFGDACGFIADYHIKNNQ